MRGGRLHASAGCAKVTALKQVLKRDEQVCTCHVRAGSILNSAVSKKFTNIWIQISKNLVAKDRVGTGAYS